MINPVPNDVSFHNQVFYTCLEYSLQQIFKGRHIAPINPMKCHSNKITMNFLRPKMVMLLQVFCMKVSSNSATIRCSHRTLDLNMRKIRRKVWSIDLKEGRTSLCWAWPRMKPSLACCPVTAAAASVTCFTSDTMDRHEWILYLWCCFGSFFARH